MNIATARATSAYHDLFDALDHFDRLSPSLRSDALGLARDYPGKYRRETGRWTDNPADGVGL